MDDPTKLGSLNMTGIAVDELIQFTRDDWTWMQGRIRVPIDGLPNQIYGATNPGPPSHWLVELFGLALGHRPLPGYRVIRSSTRDNPLLPKEYVDSVRTLPGVAYKRFFLGEWVGADGLVYDTFNRDTHVRTRSGPWARTVVAIDEGYTNPFACLLLRVDGDGRIHVEREHYQSKLMRSDKLPIIREFAEGAEAVVVDPSAAELIQTITDAGPNVEPADNTIEPGLHRVRARLPDAGDGMPRLTVDPSCENTIREFESYEFKEGTDKPRKEFDHAMDALRYGVSYIDQPKPDAFSVALPGLAELARAQRVDDGWTEWQ